MAGELVTCFVVKEGENFFARDLSIQPFGIQNQSTIDQLEKIYAMASGRLLQGHIIVHFSDLQSLSKSIVSSEELKDLLLNHAYQYVYFEGSSDNDNPAGADVVEMT